MHTPLRYLVRVLAIALNEKRFKFKSSNSSILCIPGVRFPGLTHPGIVGTAPSVELLNIWNERERKLIETSHESLKLCEVLHQRPLANLPTSENCLLGKV
jgi:acetamidase/formamidase